MRSQSGCGVFCIFRRYIRRVRIYRFHSGFCPWHGRGAPRACSHGRKPNVLAISQHGRVQSVSPHPLKGGRYSRIIHRLDICPFFSPPGFPQLQPSPQWALLTNAHTSLCVDPSVFRATPGCSSKFRGPIASTTYRAAGLSCIQHIAIQRVKTISGQIGPPSIQPNCSIAPP